MGYTADVLGALAAQIAQLDLNRGNQHSLLQKLSAARSSLARGNARTAQNQLEAFQRELDASVRSGRITPAQAAVLTGAAASFVAGSLSDSFDYTVADGQGGLATATVIVLIEP